MTLPDPQTVAEALRQADIAEFKRLCLELGERASLFDKSKPGHLRSAHDDLSEMMDCPECSREDPHT